MKGFLSVSLIVSGGTLTFNPVEVPSIGVPGI